MTFVTRFLNDESGATAIEYGLMATGIGLVIISGIGILATGVNGMFGTAAAAL
jgi:pilus assembly protein Flp/PilA